MATTLTDKRNTCVAFGAHSGEHSKDDRGVVGGGGGGDEQLAAGAGTGKEDER